MTYVHETAFLTFVITKSFSDQFGIRPFAKVFYCDILTSSLILNLRFAKLISLLELIYVFDFTSTGFIWMIYILTILYDIYRCIY